MASLCESGRKLIQLTVCGPSSPPAPGSRSYAPWVSRATTKPLSWGFVSRHLANPPLDTNLLPFLEGLQVGDPSNLGRHIDVSVHRQLMRLLHSAFRSPLVQTRCMKQLSISDIRSPSSAEEHDQTTCIDEVLTPSTMPYLEVLSLHNVKVRGLGGLLSILIGCADTLRKVTLQDIFGITSIRGSQIASLVATDFPQLERFRVAVCDADGWRPESRAHDFANGIHGSCAFESSLFVTLLSANGHRESVRGCEVDCEAGSKAE